MDKTLGGREQFLVQLQHNIEDVLNGDSTATLEYIDQRMAELQEKLVMCVNKNAEYDVIANEIDALRENNLPVSGGKIELTDRIACFLDTGKVSETSAKRKATIDVGLITENTLIESNIVCSEKHRAYFKEKIGKSFSFNVLFQKWLKSNAGKTYGDAINAYYQILEEKKKGKTTIGKQFEYNTYIRDFFEDNQGRSLDEAITCWRYKKSLQGHNRYEKSDLVALD